MSTPEVTLNLVGCVLGVCLGLIFICFHSITKLRKMIESGASVFVMKEISDLDRRIQQLGHAVISLDSKTSKQHGDKLGTIDVLKAKVEALETQIKVEQEKSREARRRMLMIGEILMKGIVATGVTTERPKPKRPDR